MTSAIGGPSEGLTSLLTPGLGGARGVHVAPPSCCDAPDRTSGATLGALSCCSSGGSVCTAPRIFVGGDAMRSCRSALGKASQKGSMNLRGSSLASVPVVGHVELAISSRAVNPPASIPLCGEGDWSSGRFATPRTVPAANPFATPCEERGTPTQPKWAARGDHDNPGWWYAAACF